MAKAKPKAEAEPTALSIQEAEQAAIEKALHPAGHHLIFGSVDGPEVKVSEATPEGDDA
jgi:hypothetical protein